MGNKENIKRRNTINVVPNSIKKLNNIMNNTQNDYKSEDDNIPMKESDLDDDWVMFEKEKIPCNIEICKEINIFISILIMLNNNSFINSSFNKKKMQNIIINLKKNKKDDNLTSILYYMNRFFWNSLEKIITEEELFNKYKNYIEKYSKEKSNEENLDFCYDIKNIGIILEDIYDTLNTELSKENTNNNEPQNNKLTLSNEEIKDKYRSKISDHFIFHFCIKTECSNCKKYNRKYKYFYYLNSNVFNLNNNDSKNNKNLLDNNVINNNMYSSQIFKNQMNNNQYNFLNNNQNIINNRYFNQNQMTFVGNMNNNNLNSNIILMNNNMNASPNNNLIMNPIQFNNMNTNNNYININQFNNNQLNNFMNNSQMQINEMNLTGEYMNQNQQINSQNLSCVFSNRINLEDTNKEINKNNKNSHKIKISDYIKQILSEYNINSFTYFCKYCNQNTIHNQITNIYLLPDILSLDLSDKDENNIILENELNLKEYTTKLENNKGIYVLISILCKNNYNSKLINYSLNPYNGCWYSYSDENYKKVEIVDINSTPFLVIYQTKHTIKNYNIIKFDETINIILNYQDRPSDSFIYSKYKTIKNLIDEKIPNDIKDFNIHILINSNIVKEDEKISNLKPNNENCLSFLVLFSTNK